MDRIAALRNIEDALAAFENGDIDLDGAERRVRTVLRTYATDFEDERTGVYRVEPPDTRAAIVVAPSPGEARDQAADIVDADVEAATVERIDGEE